MRGEFTLAAFELSFLHVPGNVLSEAILCVKPGRAKRALEIPCFCSIMLGFVVVLQILFCGCSVPTVMSLTDVRFP